MSIKLLFFIVLSLLLSSCYTRYVYVYTDEPVDEVYIYDVNYVYANLWYDDFYWRYDVGYGCNFGLFYHTPRYSGYSYYYNYKPYHNFYAKRHWKNHRHKNRFKSRHTTRRLARLFNGQNDPIGRGKARYNKQLRQKHRQDVQVKPKNRHKFNTKTKKRDQVVTKRKWNNNRSNINEITTLNDLS
jgi:hypothetical protein